MKILVVDDESAALSNFFAEIIDDADWDYKLMRDPEAALSYAQKNTPDAAFLDIVMPKIGGVELAEKLIKLSPNISIVFISGYAQDEDAIRQRLGDNLKGFCYKPYDSDTLYRFLNLVESHALIRADIKTFGLFDVALHGKSIRFSCAKSKELLALLADKEGAHVPMDMSIAHLWPDKSIELAKRLYRDAVIRLKLTLKDVGLSDLVFFYRAELAINRARADCDLWQAKTTDDFSAYHSEYMTQYADWSYAKQLDLDNLKGKD